ncbi:MAG: 3-coathanger stack domain-containing protein [Gemmatimonadota bacterium]
MSRRNLRILLSLAVGLALLRPSPSAAGTFIFSGEAFGIDIVTHPTGYDGTGGTVTVSVCIDPASPNAADMETPVQNIVATFNDLQPTTGNLVSGGDNNVPATSVDFESVALHEVGHCLGMGHPNLASESGLSDPEANATKSTDGADDVFDPGAGPDGVHGSSDDVRDDDVNLHWFRTSNNNPFTLASVVDSTTYARDTGDLPSGHDFAANAGRDVADLLLGSSDTECVMQQGTVSDEAQRTLGHDDVATLAYGMSGLDELQGTSDDYTISLSYAGLTDSCDVVLTFDDTETGFAVCKVSGSSFPSPHSDHAVITEANAFFHTGFDWFFNDEAVGSATISVRKKTIPDGDTTDFTFTGDVAGTIEDGQLLSESVPAGTYSSTETVPSGWSLVTIRCDDGDSTGDVGTATATFEVATDESVTCTFTNCSDSVQSVRDVSGQTVSTTETFEACDTLSAGSFTVEAPDGDVTFRAGKKIVLEDGFAVESGASFRAEIVGTD